MYAISSSLSYPEAISFAQSLPQEDQWYLVKISKNPNARHVAKRERYVVVRHSHDREQVKNGNAIFARRGELEDVP